jgi:hypothetical protein
MKKTVLVMLTLMIVLTSSMAFARTETDATNVIAETLVLRPMGIGALVFGSVLYVLSLPVALITDSEKDVREVLVVEPYEYVFERSMGDIGSGL